MSGVQPDYRYLGKIYIEILPTDENLRQAVHRAELRNPHPNPILPHPTQNLQANLLLHQNCAKPIITNPHSVHPGRQHLHPVQPNPGRHLQPLHVKLHNLNRLKPSARLNHQPRVRHHDELNPVDAFVHDRRRGVLVDIREEVAESEDYHADVCEVR